MPSKFCTQAYLGNSLEGMTQHLDLRLITVTFLRKVTGRNFTFLSCMEIMNITEPEICSKASLVMAGI